MLETSKSKNKRNHSFLWGSVAGLFLGLVLGIAGLRSWQSDKSVDKSQKPAASHGVDILMPDPHPLDVQLDKDIEPYSPSTLTASIYHRYEDSWDVELNRIYKQWMQTGSAEERQALRESQRAWLKFRDAQKKLLEAVYFSGPHATPTMYISFHAYADMDLIRDRAIELIRRLEARRQLHEEWKDLEEWDALEKEPSQDTVQPSAGSKPIAQEEVRPKI